MLPRVLQVFPCLGKSNNYNYNN
uniref:Uncharacterized protein n=1 Tax=Anguilla anguilla TaxID=7936 RepID=A0A0E9Q168_ANGAN